jgi:hypothetical protein
MVSMPRPKLRVDSIQQRIPGARCPRCGGDADGGTSITDKTTPPQPKPGDIAVCLYCGALNSYEAAKTAKEGLKLRELTSRELGALATDSRAARLLSVAAQSATEWRKRHKLPD